METHWFFRVKTRWHHQVDDTLSDGGSVPVSYVEYWCVVKDANGVPSSQFIGNYTDNTLSTPYNLVGVSMLAEDIGEPAGVEHKFRVLTGPVIFKFPTAAVKLSLIHI